MAYQNMAQRLSVAQYEALRQALELGRWPDGRRLTAAQKEHCMAAIIHWEAHHAADEQRTGYIDRGSKQQGQTCDDTQVLTLGEPGNDGDGTQ